MADYNGGTVRWIIDASTDSFDEKMSSVQRTVNETSSTFDTLGQSLTNILKGGFTAAATGATVALTGLVKKGIQATDFLETSRVAMSGLTGSIEEGNKAMTLAAEFWQANPFQRIDVTNATKQLVQFGRTTDQISNDLDILGDVSLSTGMNISDLARYYARVSASGRAMTMDLEMMSDRGVPIYRELEKQLNTTTAGVRKLASEGKISFEDFRKAMEGAVNQEAMDEYENTLARAVDRMKGSIQMLAGDLAGYKIVNNELVISADGLEKAWTRLVKTLAMELRSEKMREAMAKIGEALAKVLDKVTELIPILVDKLGTAISFIGEHSGLLVPILGSALALFGRLGSNLPVVGGMISNLGQNIKGLSSSLFNLVKTRPGLSALVAIFGYGFVQALKNSEEFRNTISQLLKSLSEIASLVASAIQPVLEALISAFTELASSDVVKGILQAAASAFLGIANALKSIPAPVLTSLITALLTMKMMSVSPFMGIVTAITLVVGAIQKLAQETSFFTDLPQKFATAAHNMVTGLVNGLAEGAKKVINFVKTLGTNIIKTFKATLGIHSPSTVMYSAGSDIALGLAEGITDSESVVQKAMDNLASDVLSLSTTVIQNQADFGMLDANGVYKAWKKISKLFTAGSSQYAAALEKMEDARKSVNQTIISLQEAYNDALDSTIDRISSMYGLLDDVNLKAGKNASQIISGLDLQVTKMQEWASAQEIIGDLGLDEGLVAELQAMGVDATSELSAIASMTSSELSTLNDLWLKKQAIANKAGVKQMEGLKNDTLEQISALKDGIDGETVEVKDVGGRLVANISEGITGSLPTLEESLGKLNDYITEAAKSASSSASSVADSITGGEDGYSLPEAGNEVAEQFEELSETVKKAGDGFLSILPGVLGGIVAWKFGPTILKWAKEKLFGGLGSGKLGNALQEGVSKIAQNLKKSSSPASSIGANAKTVGDSMQETSKGLSKANSTLDTIKKGAQTVIWIAGAIAAMAGALWLTYNALKDVDFLALAGQLAMMGVAVAEFGALAWAADKLDIGAKSILIIIGIAADIALVALACRAAYELMKDVDWPTFGSVLGQMAAAIAVFGVFAGIFGIKAVALAEALGLLVIAGIAADMAAVATSCKYAYNEMKDIPWEGFGNMLGQMASAIAVFGVFAGIFGIGPVALAEALGLLVIAGIASDFAAVADACRHSYDAMKEVEWEPFARMLEEMAAALGVMGGFSAVLGLLVGLEALGWASVRMICDELVQTANALHHVYEVVPDDFDNVISKIQLIKTVLNKIIDTDLGSLIGRIVASWEVGPLTRTMDMYARVAEQLARLSELTIDEQRVNQNLDYVKAALEKVRSKTDAISGWLQAWADDANASSVESAGRIIIVYGEVVDSLNKLQNLKVNQGVYSGIDAVAVVVKYVKDSSTGMFNLFSNVEGFASDVEHIKTIIERFVEMIPTIQQVAAPENNVMGIKDTALKNIQAVEEIVWQAGECGTGGWIESKAKDLNGIQSILNKFTEHIPVAWQIAQSGVDGWKDTALKQIKDVEAIVLQIGAVDTGGWIEQKENDMRLIQSILNKFTEVAKTTQLLEKYPISDNTETWVDNIKKTVNKIGSINTGWAGDAATKEWVVGMAASIAWKMAQFAKATREIGDVNTGAIDTVITTIDTMFTNIVNKIDEKVTVFEQVGNQLVDGIVRGMKSNLASVSMAGIEIQSTLWAAIESKMDDEYAQGAWMATRFGDGLKSVSFDGVGQAMQTSLWWGIQNRMNDEYQQGKAMGQSFRQGLYDVDYANSGWWAVQGFINGVYNRGYHSGGDNVWWVGYNLANEFLKGLKRRANEGSPWKTTEQSGAWAVEGLIDGIKDSEKALVGEAESLADQVAEALTMDDMSLTPNLDARLSGTPTVDLNSTTSSYSRRGRVIIEQTNNNYTEYDIDRVNRDLSWRLARV